MSQKLKLSDHQRQCFFHGFIVLLHQPAILND